MSKTIDQSRYILFGTRKRDGTMVDTPIWFAGQQGHYVAFSEGSAGKVKRLKNFSESRIAPCTVTGKALGDTVAANAELITNAHDIAAAHNSLLEKYGWQMRCLDFFSRLAGKYPHRAFIKITTT